MGLLLGETVGDGLGLPEGLAGVSRHGAVSELTLSEVELDECLDAG
jgi:hypothetical protein